MSLLVTITVQYGKVPYAVIRGKAKLYIFSKQHFQAERSLLAGLSQNTAAAQLMQHPISSQEIHPI